MMVLTFTTGINDAVGYLALDKVFTGNMTGNVVILGMAATGAEDLPVLGPALALVGFMVGAAIGGRALKNAKGAWTLVSTWLFGSVAAVMLAITAILFIWGQHPDKPLELSITTAAALSMGIQAAAARHIGIKDVTTVVVTSTITGLAADSRFGSGKGGGSARRFWAVAMILLGALAGAALLLLHLGWSMLLAGVLIAGATALGEWHRRVNA